MSLLDDEGDSDVINYNVAMTKDANLWQMPLPNRPYLPLRLHYATGINLTQKMKELYIVIEEQENEEEAQENEPEDELDDLPVNLPVHIPDCCRVHTRVYLVCRDCLGLVCSHEEELAPETQDDKLKVATKKNSKKTKKNKKNKKGKRNGRKH